MCFVCILAFRYLTMLKTLKNVFLMMFCSPWRVLFTSISVLVRNKKKKNSMHVSQNILSFLHIWFFAIILTFFLDNKLKTLKIHVNVFLYKCFVCVLTFWYVRSSKTLKRHFLGDVFLFPYRVIPLLSGGLVPITLKNTRNTRFPVMAFRFRTQEPLFL